MQLNNPLLTQWLEKLSNDNTILGVYEQGSAVWSFADSNSDRDFMVVWNNTYPSKEIRQQKLEDQGGLVHEFQDIPAVQKSVDMFELGGQRLNIAHTTSLDFFGFYSELNDLGKYYPDQLLSIGGFVHAKIYHDPQGLLEKYRKNIIFSDELVKSIKEKLDKDLGHKLQILQIALSRNSTIRLLNQAGEILPLLHLWYYTKKKMWPMSDKWFEAFAEKYNWFDDFVDLVKEIHAGLAINQIAQKLLVISKSWGFNPSIKFKS